MIGLKKGTVKLLPHNSKWKELFEKEKKALLKLDKDLILDVCHIGSTAIPNMPAKPIIDMVVGVKSLKPKKRIIELVESVGFQYDPDSDFEGRMFFIKGTDKIRTHHLSVVEYDGTVWHEYLIFKSKLKNSPDLVDKYRKLKKKLAKEFSNNRKAYTNAKANFIKQQLK